MKEMITATNQRNISKPQKDINQIKQFTDNRSNKINAQLKLLDTHMQFKDNRFLSFFQTNERFSATHTNTSSPIIQRMVIFDNPADYKNVKDVIIVKARFERPDVNSPARYTGYHTTAICVFQMIAELSVLGFTYIQALDNLCEWVSSLPEYPGVDSENYEKIKRLQSKCIQYIQESKQDTNFMNWAVYIDIAADKAIKVRNHLNYTYHLKGNGLETSDDEKGSLYRFMSQMDAYKFNSQYLAHAILGLLDYRCCTIDRGKNLIEQAKYYLCIWHQHMLSLVDAYPILNEPKYHRAINYAYSQYSLSVCNQINIKHLIPKSQSFILDKFPYPLVTCYQ